MNMSGSNGPHNSYPLPGAMSDYDILQDAAEEMDLDTPQYFAQNHVQMSYPGFQQPMKSAATRHHPQLQLQQAQQQAVSTQMRQQMQQPVWSSAPSVPQLQQGRTQSSEMRQHLEETYAAWPSTFAMQRPHMSPEMRQQMSDPASQTSFQPNGPPRETKRSTDFTHPPHVVPQEQQYQSQFWIMPHDFFEYSPLKGPREIRVLRISPGVGDAALDCELYHTDIDSNWEYSALSYAWGDRNATAEVICNGKRLRITASLHGALRRIRSTNYAVQVWADAICINQQDVAERGHQVRLMRSIYKKAKSVLIWLGPDDQQTASAVFAAAKKIFLKDMISIPPPEDDIWVGFALLFGRPWFWRLWCLQEITLASSAQIIWGPESISWESLGFAAAWIRTVGYQILRNVPLQGVHNAYLMYALSLSSDKHDPVSFLHLLTLTRQFRVSDLRDRVFALLGLPTIDANPDEGILFVDPDYTKSTEEVYAILAKKMVVSSQGLRTLSAVQHGLEVQENLPSWVPQWDRLFTYTLAQAGKSLKNHAASATLPISIPRIHNSLLAVDGLDFDTVTSTSDVLPDSLDPSTSTSFEYIQTIWDTMAAPLSNYPAGTKDLYTAFCWTITAGKDWYGMLVEHELEHLADFAAFQERHFAGAPLPDAATRRRVMPFGIPEMARQQLLGMPSDRFYHTIARFTTPDVTQPARSGPDADRFVTALSYACRWRRFFVTRRGFMGIGPPCMREGDVVSILSGGIVPFLLRPRGEYYKLVGEAYIYGIMNGEACEQPLRENLQVGTFSLS